MESLASHTTHFCWGLRIQPPDHGGIFSSSGALSGMAVIAL